MLRSPTDTARSPAAIEALLRALGPRLRRGGGAGEPAARLATGLPELDALLGGGFPCGGLSEIAGPASSGRTTLALALLARTTGPEERLAAVVDGADAFDPTSADAAGVALERVLWVRAPAAREALRCSERLLEARGFALLLLDLASPEPPRLAPAVWPRLARAAEASGTAWVVLSTRRMTGTAAALALEMAPTRARFTGTPALLEGLEIRGCLVRQRTAPGGLGRSLQLRTSTAA